MKAVSDRSAKAKLRAGRKVPGKAGSHGVGLHPSTGETVTVYRERQREAAEEKVLIHELRKDVYPFQVEIRDDEAPTITSPAVGQAPPCDEEE